MAASRLCIFLAVLVSVKMMAAQPIFGSQMWCDLMCDDDDDDDDYSDGDIFDLFFGFDLGCGSCTPSKPTKTKPATNPSATQQPISLVIPPANGMNVTMSNTGHSWLMNFVPWPFMASAATAAPASTTAAPATTAAGTTAAGNTTAAPTTAKA